MATFMGMFMLVMVNAEGGISVRDFDTKLLCYAAAKQVNQLPNTSATCVAREEGDL
jgi:hypothetical protein